MWTIRVPKRNVPRFFNRSITTVCVSRQESRAVYPPILDLKPEPTVLRQELNHHEKIRNIGTIEEKTIGINMPRYYGWQSLVVKDKILPYDFLPFAQTITKTKIYEVENLPNKLSDDDYQKFIDHIKPQLEDSLVFEFNRNSRGKEINPIHNTDESNPTNDLAKSVAEQVNRIFLANLAADYPHLYEAQIDYEPRVEGFWNVHGFAANKEDQELRKKKNVPEENLKDPVDRWIHYFGVPTVQVRHSLPLSSVPLDKFMLTSTPLSHSDDIPNIIHRQFDVPNYDFDPQIYHKLPYERRHGVSIPGFWPNDPQKFGLLSIHTNEYLVDRPPNFGELEHQEAVHAQAILASFAWLIGQASYQGFTICNEITYPLVNQSIITNGKTWSFYMYQLNTMRFFKSKDTINNNSVSPSNICWGTKTMELFHDVTDTQIVGWNDETLKNLLSCYVNTPKIRDHEMSPYLGKEQVVANIDDANKRIWLHEKHKVMVSHRPRHRLLPEVYDWERIYKIQFETRQFEARRRFFELDQDPLNERKLNDHYGAYIQRKDRDFGRRIRSKRFADTYYPNV
ncbi:Hypothetical protein CINCED_3A006840 [Cinara cedri]|uniref:28S ribosomal protein S30, mitochondrial n=1 Tax=Cinara cedri TaxID=506608 RepID=A0A5E4MNK6_9HEMI|nr:Hypothetical protein CINCED_3A006840 [Cinara cedri]